MFKVVINAKILKNAIESISSLVEECKIEVSDTGLEVKSVDAANICMVCLKMAASSFEFFKTTPGSIGVDLVRLEDALAMAKDDEAVALQLDEENMKLLVGMGGLSYKLSLIDITALRKPPVVPEVDLPVWVDMAGFEFKHIIKAAKKVSDHIAFGMDDAKFIAGAKGDIDSVRFERELSLMLGGRHGQAHSLFSLDYLEDMAKAAGKAPSVHLEIGNNYPMRLVIEIAKGVLVEYLLAPRIEQES